MSGALRASSISAPAFLGLNTQDSEVTLESGFATEATNCIIDRYGRLGSRRGWQMRTTDNGSLSNTEVIDSLFEFKLVDGSYIQLSTSLGRFYKGLNTLVEQPIRNSNDTANVSSTTTNPHFQWAATVKGAGHNAVAQAFVGQRGSPLICYNKHDGVNYIFQRISDIGSVPAGLSVSTFDPNCLISAYGRLWAGAITNNRLTLWYSRLLDGTHFTGTGTGLLDISAVVGNNDEIVGLASHNNFLVIFCKNNIVIYQNADDPTIMSVADVITGVGCISRDSIQNTGTDLVFLSKSGVRSLARTIQEKSMPMRELSLNIRDTLLDNLDNELPENIKSIYFERDAFYLLLLPSSKVAYYFDLRNVLETGASKVTVWNNIKAVCFCVSEARKMYMGVVGGIGEYFGYTDNGESYRMVYFTSNSEVGAPQTLKLLKKLNVVVLGNNSQTYVIKYSFDYKPINSTRFFSSDVNTSTSQYNVSEYGIGEYSSGIVVTQIRVNAGGSGNVVKMGIETDITGAPVSIQQVQVYLKLGKLI
jgi:hypothetical protein